MKPDDLVRANRYLEEIRKIDEDSGPLINRVTTNSSCQEFGRQIKLISGYGSYMDSLRPVDIGTLALRVIVTAMITRRAALAKALAPIIGELPWTREQQVFLHSQKEKKVSHDISD